MVHLLVAIDYTQQRKILVHDVAAISHKPSFADHAKLTFHESMALDPIPTQVLPLKIKNM
jgi:cephalosporin hydroxylase